MARQLNSRQGFTLIELMIVVAIIGIIAVLLIPNFLDAIQKAKQKRTVSDQKVIGTAMMNWLAEQASAAAAASACSGRSVSGVRREVKKREKIRRGKGERLHDL